MSTAGKVLTVLVALVAVVWVVLTSAVAQLNRNGTKALEDLQANVIKVEAELKTVAYELQRLKDELSHDQYVTEKALTVLATKQTNVERAWSESKETLERVKLQLEDATATVASANEDKAQRIADKEAETKALAQARADVEALKVSRTEQVARLTELREKFKSTLD
jgi:hypothetical protein